MSGLSVLLAVHNGETSLDRCLTTLAAQSLQPERIICVDDASTDTTAEVLAAWQRRLGSQLSVIRNARNLGLTKSLNRGLAAVATRYTARIDADDWWRADKLARQEAFLAAHPEHGVVGCAYWNVGEHGRTAVRPPETDRQIRSGMIRRNPFAHSCVVFRTELVRSLGGYDEAVRYGQDYDLWLRCRPLTAFHNLPDLLCYRSVGSGISVDKQRQQMLQSVKTQLKYLRAYRMPALEYLALAEPLAVAATPAWIRSFKRRLVG